MTMRIGGHCRLRLNLRLVLGIILLELVVLGVALAFDQRTVNAEQTIMVQTGLCVNPVNSVMQQNQIIEYNCGFTPNSWADVTLSARRPLSLVITMAGQGFSPEIIYNSTGTVFDLTFPFFSNASVVFQLKNVGLPGSQVQGSVGVFALTAQQATLETTIFPYRILGLVIAAVAFLMAWFLIWDPRGYASKAVKRLSGARISPSQEPEA